MFFDVSEERSASFFRVEVSYPEDGGSKFLQTLGKYPPNYTALGPRRFFYPECGGSRFL
jgi:hypothetical protein